MRFPLSFSLPPAPPISFAIFFLRWRAMEIQNLWLTPQHADPSPPCEDTKLIPGYWDCMIPTKEAVNGLVYHFNGIGSMFNSDFSGWRPLYYVRFRYYYDFVLKEPDKKVCSVFKRLLFWLLSSGYPSYKFMRLIFHRKEFLVDNIYRQLFFAWLWRHAKWR